MIYAILLSIFLITSPCSMAEMTSQNNQIKKEIHFLSSEEAQKYGQKGFNRYKHAYPKEWSESMGNSIAAQPLLVKRIDRKKSYYYIVPFNIRDEAKLLIIIDAISGKLKEVLYLKEPVSFPRITKGMAIQILTKYLEERKIATSIEIPIITLVWVPSEQTQSPFEPLWRIQIQSKEWFIDQKGKVYDEILKIRMKGG